MLFVIELQNVLLFIEIPFIKTMINLWFYLFNKYLPNVSSVPFSVPRVEATGKYSIWFLLQSSWREIYVNKQWEVLLQKDDPKL